MGAIQRQIDEEASKTGDDPPLIQAAFDNIMNDHNLLKGSDWVYEISPTASVYVIYAHRACHPDMFEKYQGHLSQTIKDLGILNPGLAPLRSSAWLLLRPDDNRFSTSALGEDDEELSVQELRFVAEGEGEQVLSLALVRPGAGLSPGDDRWLAEVLVR